MKPPLHIKKHLFMRRGQSASHGRTLTHLSQFTDFRVGHSQSRLCLHINISSGYACCSGASLDPSPLRRWAGQTAQSNHCHESSVTHQVQRLEWLSSFRVKSSPAIIQVSAGSIRPQSICFTSAYWLSTCHYLS